MSALTRSIVKSVRRQCLEKFQPFDDTAVQRIYGKWRNSEGWSMTLTRRRYLLFIVYNILSKGDPIPDRCLKRSFSNEEDEGEKFQRKEFLAITRNIGYTVSDIRGITHETFKERCIFLPFRCLVYPTRNLSSRGGGRANVTYAANRIVDRLRSIYFQYSFSVNGSRRHNAFAEYKTFGKSTVISHKPDSMPPLSSAPLSPRHAHVLCSLDLKITKLLDRRTEHETHDLPDYNQTRFPRSNPIDAFRIREKDRPKAIRNEITRVEEGRRVLLYAGSILDLFLSLSRSHLSRRESRERKNVEKSGSYQMRARLDPMKFNHISPALRYSIHKSRNRRSLALENVSERYFPVSQLFQH